MEAQLAELQRQMQQMQVQQQQMLGELDAARQQAADAQGALGEEQRLRREAQAQARIGQPGIDTKLIGKPQDYYGEDDKWFEWATVFRGYAGAAVAGMDDLMTEVEKDSEQPAVNVVLQPEEAAASKQLYWMLLMICKSSALRVVMSVDKGEGAEAWRKLVARYEPRTQQRQATQMVALLNLDLSGDLEDKTLNWERQIAVYEEQAKKAFADDLRIGARLRAAPESAVKTRVLMKTDLARWADFARR